MTQPKNARRPLIVGNPALIMVDFQRGGAYTPGLENGIPLMDGHAERQRAARSLVACARENGVPIIFIQEVHRPDLVDMGRELDGTEDVHCLEGMHSTEIAAEEVDFRPGDYHVPKRRYSAFYGTDFEILLKGLNIQTLILTGGLTDVCVHYTFADGHQGNYYCRVVEDCVGGSSIDAHNASLRAMEYLQTGARCKSTDILAAFAARKAFAS
ncbi:MAG: cysteine hydrolase [Pseudomonadota bacterium]|nr:cysteine hydrolase [Pseudomonadota bacterium]